MKKYPRKSYTLFLSSRKCISQFSYRCIIALWKRLYKIVYGSFLAGIHNFFICRIKLCNSYIVLYGAAGILGGMLTIIADYGVNLEGKRNQLLISLQDHLENVMWPRLERESDSERTSAAAEAKERRESANVRIISRDRDRRLSGARRGAEQTAASKENVRESTVRDKTEDRSAKDWLDDLSPEQKRMLGEMLKEFL